MNSNQLKNIIILKNLPSNIIDEAFIVLKDNKKMKLLERIEKKSQGQEESNQHEEYIVKEAEMVISNYLSGLEKEKQIRSYSLKNMENKYKRLRAITIVLSIGIILNILVNMVVA